MKRKRVESSSIASVGYERENRALEIKFHSGEVYQYYGFPWEEYEAFMNAESKGRYFSYYIRPFYEYMKI